ncbi:hypothetical protein GQ457_08G013400 [Hibiscus cannabinus]
MSLVSTGGDNCVREWRRALLGVKAQTSKGEAYVTLLYGDEFQPGVRVLGKSTKNTSSSKDMLVLVYDYAKKLLKFESKRFWGVYTKLKVFNMTNYKKGVMVVEPSEAVFNDIIYSQNVGLYMLANKVPPHRGVLDKRNRSGRTGPPKRRGPKLERMQRGGP